MFSEPGEWALASPLPIAAEPVVLEQERNDFGVVDSETDKFDTESGLAHPVNRLKSSLIRSHNAVE
jgi:hypothetical protein